MSNQQRGGDTVVVDTETLATDKRALVLTLSAVRFNRYAAELGLSFDNGEPFMDGETTLHLKLNVTEQLLAGRTVDPGTVKWWNGRGDAARASIINGHSVSTREALALFSGFMPHRDPAGGDRQLDTGKRPFPRTLRPARSHL
ncbi:3'-5' exoribonuclease domain-containing protein [Aeromonas veronii]|uniref:3'-5' exoribonuclease domain-containing protein n=1 Tax=Aeromonas veronii TaxID=654 RepID=UPI0012DAEEF2|nr:3'-5' exoribonuclease [Aeromonas veronii]